MGTMAGGGAYALLQPGRHALQITFPPGPEARGEVKVRLEYVAPP